MIRSDEALPPVHLVIVYDHLLVGLLVEVHRAALLRGGPIHVADHIWQTQELRLFNVGKAAGLDQSRATARHEGLDGLKLAETATLALVFR